MPKKCSTNAYNLLKIIVTHIYCLMPVNLDVSGKEIAKRTNPLKSYQWRQQQEEKEEEEKLAVTTLPLNLVQGHMRPLTTRRVLHLTAPTTNQERSCMKT